MLGCNSSQSQISERLPGGKCAVTTNYATELGLVCSLGSKHLLWIQENAQSLVDFGKGLGNKLAQHVKNYQMDAVIQQLLGKLLGEEKGLDGELQGVNDKTNSLAAHLNSSDNDTKNNSQTMFNLQESIHIQTEQVKRDNSSLIDGLTIVQDATTRNQGRFESLERAGPESIKNLGRLKTIPNTED